MVREIVAQMFTFSVRDSALLASQAINAWPPPPSPLNPLRTHPASMGAYRFSPVTALAVLGGVSITARIGLPSPTISPTKIGPYGRRIVKYATDKSLHSGLRVLRYSG